MTVSEMIRTLTTILATQGDIEVMFNDGRDEIRAVSYCNVHITEEGEFPEDWDMPEGFTFVEIGQ